ncbi:glycosyltransferase [Acetobacter sp. AAB5]|uniref:glycosyltransferase n=1 Tax=Acetobacter sp. AAB5 TaxID=3418370 RepID=UPI003CE7DAAE
MSSEDPDNQALCIPYIAYRQNLFWKKQKIIVIPACNEENHIIPCLLALAAQYLALPDKVILWINNTTDQTYKRALSLQKKLPFTLEIIQIVYDPTIANAGTARREAMAYAAKNAPHDALLFTTDADGEVSRDWIYRTLKAFAQYPVEAVFGQAQLLPSEYAKIPLHLHEDERAEQAYGALLEQITLLLYPQPHDPWPRHIEHSGASIAVTHQAWTQVGGIPNVPSGEDRQFYEALRQHDICVRHAPEVIVYVSARLAGRAQGGMAETLARRMIAQDKYIDDAFETVSRRLFRVRRELAYRQTNPSAPISKAHTELLPTRILREDLPKHYKRAERVLNFLRRTEYCLSEDWGSKTTDQYGIPPRVHYDPVANAGSDRPE